MKKKLVMLAVTALVAASLAGCGKETAVVDSITEEIVENMTEESVELSTEEEKLADEATEAIMDEIKKITEEASASEE